MNPINGEASVRGADPLEVEVEAAVSRAGYGWLRAERAGADEPLAVPMRDLVVAWLAAAGGFLVRGALADWAVLALLAGVLALVGREFLAAFWTTIRTRHYSMETLIGVGVSGAFGHQVAALVLTASGQPMHGMGKEGLLLFAIYLTGQHLETRLRARADAAVEGLLELAPPVALLMTDSGKEERPLASVAKGDVVVVLPGAAVPLDGVVLEGSSEVDESLVTGEADPVRRGPGDRVVGGTTNGSGRLVVEVAAAGGEGYLARLSRMVEDASAEKIPVRDLADRIVAVFVPVVLWAAAGAAVLWAAWPEGMDRARLAVAGPLGLGGEAMAWWLVALAVLVVSCPCPLGIAVPLALFIGAGRGARAGVVIRSGQGLQDLRLCDTLVVDKTGTLTHGRPDVSAIVPAPEVDEDDLLAVAAAVEEGSEHPLGRAIRRAAAERGGRLEASGWETVAGLGISSTVAGEAARAGKPAWIGETAEALAASLPSTATPVAVEKSGVLLGVIGLEDTLRPEAPGAVSDLKRLGLRVVVASGDREGPVRAMAEAAGADSWHAALAPEEKVALVSGLQGEGRQVLFAGDGLNDGPALAAARVGVAMGTGTDLAKEAGDLVLAGGDLGAISRAVRLSRATFSVVGQNLFWAAAYNLVAIPLAFIGILHPAAAQAAMVGSDVIVIANSLRLQAARLDSPNAT